MQLKLDFFVFKQTVSVISIYLSFWEEQRYYCESEIALFTVPLNHIVQ